MGDTDKIELHSSNIAIIREVYDSENANESFEIELDRALEAKCSTIIIEPTKLGDETARWIQVGNYLSLVAISAGVSSMVIGITWRKLPITYVPLTAVSALCSALYTISWQFDPCVQYQVETDPRKLNRILVTSLSTSTNPVVLARKPEVKQRYTYAHGSVVVLAVAFCTWNLLRSSK